ncbi:hypothetical protein J6590_017408 [Homalodisca vitripennis]|nr:hypothetical protein J6590_017408 [Homalodisca vitripennis]
MAFTKMLLRTRKIFLTSCRPSVWPSERKTRMEFGIIRSKCILSVCLSVYALTLSLRPLRYKEVAVEEVGGGQRGVEWLQKPESGAERRHKDVQENNRRDSVEKGGEQFLDKFQTFNDVTNTERLWRHLFMTADNGTTRVLIIPIAPQRSFGQSCTSLHVSQADDTQGSLRLQ